MAKTSVKNAAVAISSIRMSANKTIEQFIDRFNALRRRAMDQVPADALPGNVFRQLQTAATFLPDSKKYNVDFMMASAKDMLYSQENNVRGSASAGPSQDRSTGKRSREANDSGRSKHANTGSFSSASASSSKFCSFHRVRTHNTEDCHAAGKAKDTSSAPSSFQSKIGGKSQWANYGNSPSAASASNSKCGALGWTPQHRCNTARSDDSPPHFAGMFTGNNAAAEIAIPTTPATPSQLDIAISELIEADVAKQVQLCKSHSIFSEPPKHKSNMITLPIILENIKTYAMLDSGSTTSMVSPKFVSSLGLHIEPIPQEYPNFIQLGHSSSRTSRIGLVFISIYYNKVIVKHKFEVFDIFTTINNANIPCLILFGYNE